MHTVLTTDGAAALRGSWQRASASRVPQRARRRYFAAAAIAAVIAAAGAGDRWLRVTTLQSLPLSPLPAAKLFRDPIAMSITVSSGLRRAPWATTDAELLGSIELWKRMHLADWDGVPEALRVAGLDSLLDRYRHILNNPSAWDRMDAFNWDAVPQPVRTVAYRRMVAYWSGFYRVGAEFNLPAPAVSDTLAAIVMSESWFDHRARSWNRDGAWDVGLGQASPFARRRLSELHAAGRVDATLSDADHDNPWMATRFVALWMKLMLEESDGDLDLAVRVYNRGRADAPDRLGSEYLAAVHLRLARYIRNRDAPSSWDHVWRRARELVRMAPDTDIT